MTKKELVGGIKAFWSNAMTAAKCQRYIEHTHVVLPKIITFTRCLFPQSFDSNHSTMILFAFLGILTLRLHTVTHAAI